ncbi:MAG: hypothetical protein CNE88_04225 [Acidimicrobiales bacterium MED-G01]|nr:MAG: hypothetical protein CNE88_04225 [Acidimicrobiales bacterium MED-G01]
MLRKELRLLFLLLAAGVSASCAGTPPSARLSPSSTTVTDIASAEGPVTVEGSVPDLDDDQDVVPTTAQEIEDSESWPLTGIGDDQVGNWPVLIVKIDNHDRARPQSGVNSADVVFEEIVEGGLTRFAALFHSQQAEHVGPIRSVRTSDFDLLRNLNKPLFANSGGNEAVLELLQEVDYVDVSSNAAMDVYERMGERPSPHNLFSDTKSLRVVGTSRGDGGSPPKMFVRQDAGDGLPASATRVTGVNLDYGSTFVNYRWNEQEGWIRTQNGTIHVDTEGVAIAPDVIIVQVVSYTRSRADGRSPEAVLLGEGRSLVLFEGSLIEGTWKRTQAEEVTRYFDRDGLPIAMPPGRVWIALPRVGQVQVVE